LRWARLTAAGFLFWLILTAALGWWTVLLGLLVAALVAALAVRILTVNLDAELSFRDSLGLLLYTMGLVPMVLPAAWQVAGVVVRRNPPVHPCVIRHRTGLTRPVARAALANSVTLTPGTHCVDLEDDLLTVHCLDPRFAEALSEGVLERRLAAILERSP